MDDLDRAKEYEMKDRQVALDNALQREQQPPARYNDNGERICINCNAVIPPQRLDAYPEAVRCVSCKKQYEQQEVTR